MLDFNDFASFQVPIVTAVVDCGGFGPLGGHVHDVETILHHLVC